ncbi:MAG: hypothetical protein ABI776_11505, partial [Nocardioidaceae bacterium]
MSAMVSEGGSVWTRRDGKPGRLGILFACVWLVFLVTPLQDGWRQRDSWHGRLGLLTLAAFVATYVMSFALTRQRRMRGDQVHTPVQAAALLAALTVLGAMTSALVGQSGTATVVYVAVTAVMWLPGSSALAVVTVLAVAADLSGRVVPGWQHDSSLSFAV